MTNAGHILENLRHVERYCEQPRGKAAVKRLRNACRTLAALTDYDGATSDLADELVTAAERDPKSPDFWLQLYGSLQAFLAAMQAAAETSQAGRIWAAGQNLAEFVLELRKFVGLAPEQGWANDFALAVCNLAPVQAEMNRLVSLVDGNAGAADFTVVDIDQALQRAGQLIEHKPDAPLLQYIAGFRRGLVRELHGAWRESHVDRGEPSPAEAYAWHWNESLGRDILNAARVTELAGLAAQIATSVGVEETADYMRNVDGAAFYGIANVLPPVPRVWHLESGDGIDQHLHYGLARWYFRPLSSAISPIDVIVGVIKTRRPYYYHRVLAHALLQTLCVEQILGPTIDANPAVEKLATFCDLILEGQRLREQYARNLNSSGAWLAYLADVINLHFPNGESAAPAIGGSGVIVLPAFSQAAYGRPN